MQKKGKLKWIIATIILLGALGTAACGKNENEVKDVTADKQENSGSMETEQQPEEAESDQQTEEAESEAEEKTEFYMGETAEQNGVQISLLSVTESEGSEFLKPEEGNIYLICEFEIFNNSEKDINISSIMNFEAYCDDYSINQDIMGLQAPEVAGKSQLDGSVASGKKMNGIIAYQVPSSYSTMEVNVSPDFWSGKDIKFIYNK